jgi:hypothetical protein
MDHELVTREKILVSRNRIIDDTLIKLCEQFELNEKTNYEIKLKVKTLRSLWLENHREIKSIQKQIKKSG